MTFSPKDVQMASIWEDAEDHYIRKMQVKTTRYHFKLTRMGITIIFKKMENHK